MSLTARAFGLISLAAALGIVAIWSADPVLAPLWLVPCILVLAGLAVEGGFMVRTRLHARVETGRAYLGRPLEASFLFRNEGRVPVTLDYVPVVPAGFRHLVGTRRVNAPAQGAARDGHILLPERLGAQSWPPIPARLRGVLGLSWWSRRLPVELSVSVAPDLSGANARGAYGAARGASAGRATGAGAELRQLRDYRAGDPLHRIDWKATARRGVPVAREFIEDQHLEIVLALDAGRTAGLEAGRLNRLGLYANLAARFAERAALEEDRVGLLVFADRPLAVLPPARGLAAVARIRAALEGARVEAAESSPLAAALRARELARHRSLVVLLTDPGESTPTEELLRAVRLLQANHFTLVAAVVSEEIERLAEAPPRGWLDPYIALAAHERQVGLRARVGALRRLGAAVVIDTPGRLEGRVLEEYRRLRGQRRI